MKIRNIIYWMLPALLCVALSPLDAAWQLVQDFEAATSETTNTWKRFPPQGDIYIDTLDPDNTGNKVIFVDGGPPVEGLVNMVRTGWTLPDGGVAEGSVATLKVDLYLYGSAVSVNAGLSDVAVEIDEGLSVANGKMIAPNQWGDYESQFSLLGADFRVRDGNGFKLTGKNLPIEEWLTLYLVIDNGSDSSLIYLKTASDDVPQLVTIQDGVGGTQETFIFRNGTTDPLVTFYLSADRTGTGAQDDVWVMDNVYIDYSGANLDGGSLPSSWSEWPVDDNSFVNTGEFMNWLWVAHRPWIYVFALDGWAYIPEPDEGFSGAWAYIVNPEGNPGAGGQNWAGWSLDDGDFVNTGDFMQWLWVSGDWVWSFSLMHWVYLPEPTAGFDGAWTYIDRGVVVEVVDYAIPAAAMVPTLDGVMDEGEWDSALETDLTYSALIENGTGYSLHDGQVGSPDPSFERAGGNVYLNATKRGLYFAAEIIDGNVFIKSEFGGKGNVQDGVQILIDLNPDPENTDSSVILDFSPASIDPQTGQATGPASIFSHWRLAGYDEDWGIEVAGVVDGPGYVLEGFIPWFVLQELPFENHLTQGETFSLSFIILDYDQAGTLTELLTDFGNGTDTIGTPATWNKAEIAEDLTEEMLSYSIPKAATAPVVDGIINAGEWDNSLDVAADYGNLVTYGTGLSFHDLSLGDRDPDFGRAGGRIRGLWTDDGLFLLSEISDATPYFVKSFPGAGNSQDGVQFCIDLNPAPTGRTSSVIFDFAPVTVVGSALTGPANIWAHFALAGYDEAWGITASGSLNEGNGTYLVETFIPWTALTALYPTDIVAGYELKFSLLIIDFDASGTFSELMGDFGNGVDTIGTPATWNTAVLTDN